MPLGQREIQARKNKILGITVAKYIQTITPVSSSYIARASELDLSSATIRNILAELEQEGFLTHPHTSAGRVPTQEGYRYYVDHLLHEIHLLEDEKARIKAEYERGRKELDLLLEKTSQIISDTTHYTSIVSVDGSDNKIYLKGTSFVVGYPEIQDLQKIRYILEALEEKQRILKIINQDIAERIKIFIGTELACQEIESCCSLVVTPYKVRKGPTGRIAVLGPTSMDYEKVISTISYITDLMEEVF